MPTLICPADVRQENTLPGSAWGGEANSSVAFTGYLGNGGAPEGNENMITAGKGTGVLFWKSRVRIVDINDGTSNTLLVGERPPSQDLNYGWWFAGAGWDGSGAGDVVMGSRMVNYAASLGCPASKVGFQQGNISDPCDQAHFWSMHSGGGNFLMADRSVRFMSYGANAILPQMMTRSGGETFNDSIY